MKYALLIAILLAGCGDAVFDREEVQAVSEACIKSNGVVVSRGYSNRTHTVSCRAQFYGEKK